MFLILWFDHDLNDAFSAPVIADPATEQEKTYVQSCGENGTLRIALQEGYQKLYADEACTQETTTFDENGERTVYTVKEP